MTFLCCISYCPVVVTDIIHAINDDHGVQETGDYVSSQLSLIYNNVEKGLSSYNSATHGAPGKYFDSLVVEIQKAQKLLTTDGTRLLSSYQLEKAQATYNQLKAAIESTRSKVEPKKKFAFKSEKKKTALQVIFMSNLAFVVHRLIS